MSFQVGSPSVNAGSEGLVVGVGTGGNVGVASGVTDGIGEGVSVAEGAFWVLLSRVARRLAI
ncbi:MAG TPA: hypothetical protein DEQ80_09725 [Anaerolinea thermolimosa]|uniref:Uncharacterized protein n=1 Tax=Anaerolinea thermolimosa TaxID=229919 RepID=A0A3D1JI63_9CHLR|nr:hypothetical protein [Anaerolinea thermolimosa]